MAEKKYSVDDILKIFNKLNKRIEELYCFVKECCSKVPVNVGIGIGIYKKFNQNKWEFKSLLPGAGVNITEGNNEITISATAQPVSCDDIKDCLGITESGDPDKYLNEQGDWVAITVPPTNPLLALPFTTDHITATNNQYLIDDVVWYSGNVYRCIANNDSILPTNALYWVNLGLGFPLVQQPVDWNSTSGNNQILNKPTIPTGTVTGVTATSPITSSGGTTPDISTSMNTNKLIGRTSIGTGVMEEISVGTGLTLSSGTLNATAQVSGFEMNFLLMGA